ncbi:LytTR family DNA-binding domain-containing protein [Runella sp. MFBS21]|uniref:LytR/AlgR family response regulator transcription factor n=1 Tax=Runella sp. MFBS21 TaxID=3034018 RepID=UPI0023F76BF3|nr:LytTR family DNA-binding domain-containing protein [Runella sp. MFBS21]MDF7818309.1 LytTR family DNA-binding domain-containing protein [Runella sp. MFBS21]
MRNYLPLILEDDATSALLLESFLQQLPLFEKPIICTSAMDALGILQSSPIDLLFLDIHLPDFMGLDLLNMIVTPPPVVITTADPNLAVQSFDYDVADYLLKPLTFPRTVRAINRALSIKITANSITSQNSIFLKAGRQLRRFLFEEIDYIEAFGIYSKLIGHQGTLVVNEPISTLEERLPKRSFARVQKSFIVNLDKVNGFDSKSLFVGSTKIPIGSAYRETLKNFWWFGEAR